MRPSLILKNESTCAIDVAVLDPNDNRIVYSFTIAVGEEGTFPILMLSLHKLRFRPASLPSYQWSKEIVDWKEIFAGKKKEKKKKNYCVTSTSTDSSLSPFLCQLSMKSAMKKNKNYEEDDKFTNNSFVLVLHPPVILENLLPYDIKYRVVDREFGLEVAGFLLKGQRSSLHSVHLDHLIGLNIELSGCQRTTLD